MAKQRHYNLKYWNKAGKFINETLPFKNENEAYHWVYDLGLPCTIKYVGFK